MNKRDASGECCKTPYQCYRGESQNRDGLTETIVKLKTDQPQELSPQHIIVMMGAVVAGISFLFTFVIWYFGAAFRENVRETPPV